MVTKEELLDGLTARKIRLELGLTQDEFWAPLFTSKTSIVQYELGRSPLPSDTRRLMFLKYVAGIPIDASLPALKALVTAHGKSISDSADAINKAYVIASDAVDALSLTLEVMSKGE